MAGKDVAITTQVAGSRENDIEHRRDFLGGATAQRGIYFLEQPRRRMHEALQDFPVTEGGVRRIELAGCSVIREHHRIRMKLR